MEFYEIIQPILLQFFIIVFPLILIQALYFHQSRYKVYKAYIIAFLCGISGLLCMTFSITITEGSIADMRAVPFFLIFAYGNYIVGSIILISLIAYRSILGGQGLYITLIVTVALLPLLYFIQKFFKKLSIKNKYIIAATFVTLPVFIDYLIMSQVVKDISYTYLLLELFSLMTIGISIYIMESLERIELYQTEIKNSEKIRLIGQLSASMAHEIRNPMTTVKGFLQLLQSSKGLTDSEKEFVRVSDDELNRANQIISDYLSLSKPSKEQVDDEFDLVNAVNQATQSVQPLAILNQVRISTEIEVNHIIINGDQNRVKQVLLNLIKNAIEASKQNGEIIVSAYIEKQHAYIKVQDFGIGMNEDQLSKLGEPFYSMKANGTGLGLMISFSIIEEMNGRIYTESEVNKGTTISIKFPIMNEKSKFYLINPLKHM